MEFRRQRSFPRFKVFGDEFFRLPSYFYYSDGQVGDQGGQAKTENDKRGHKPRVVLERKMTGTAAAVFELGKKVFPNNEQFWVQGNSKD